MALTLALSATAGAAPFTELPFREVPTAAVCVRATGAPGELLRWTRGGVQLMRARADGLTDTSAVTLGKLSTCPVVAADRTTGAAVIVGMTRTTLVTAARAPGGGWSAPQRIKLPGSAGLSVAVSARGDALLSWVESSGDREAFSRIRAALKPAGATAWSIQNLTRRFKYGFDDAAVAGMSSAGEAFVAFQQSIGSSNASRMRVSVVTAAPGARRLSAPRSLATTEFGAAEPALAVAPDGRALVAAGGVNDLSVFERAPGASDFSGPVTVFTGAVTGAPVVGLRPDGAAVLAWTQGLGEPLFSVMRSAPGPWGPLQRSAVPFHHRHSSSSIGYVVERDDIPFESEASLALAFAADGAALVAYPTELDGFAVATLTAAGAGDTQLLGSTLRRPLGLTPVVLADGTHAVAWSDNRGQGQGSAQHGRLHYAVQGAPAAPAPAAPTLTVGAPARRALRPSQPLVLPIRCSAACDVRASLPGQDAGADLTASLAHAGRTTLTFRPFARALAPADGGPLKVTFTYGAPGTRTPIEQVVPVRLRRLPAPPFPEIVNLRVARAGRSLVVRWDTDVAATDVSFFVYGTRASGQIRDAKDLLTYGSVSGKGRRHFHVRLKNAAKVRFVRLEATRFVGRQRRTRTIPVE